MENFLLRFRALASALASFSSTGFPDGCEAAAEAVQLYMIDGPSMHTGLSGSIM